MQDFLNKIIKYSENKSTAELKIIIEQLAQQIPRNKHKEILDSISYTRVTVSNRHDTLDADAILNNLKRLLENVCNYEIEVFYDDDYYYYNDYDENNNINDDGFSEEYSKCYKDVIRLLENGMYREAYQGFELLYGIIEEFDDTQDYSFDVLIEENALELDLVKMCCLWGYCRLKLPIDKNTFEDVYYAVSRFSGKIGFNDILKAVSEPINEIDTILEKWISFLMKKPSEDTAFFMREAAELTGNFGTMFNFVKTVGDKTAVPHYELLKMLEKAGQYEDAVTAGCKALDILERALPKRDKVADILINTAKAAGNIQAEQLGIVERYYSAQTLTNFLPLYSVSLETANKAAMEMTKIREHDYFVVKFLHGDYEYILNEILKDKSVLGWSYSIKGTIVPLFAGLITGFKDEYKITKNIICQKLQYSGDTDEFYSIANKFHVNVSPDEIEMFYNVCIKEMDYRIDAIVGGGHRKSYYKAAELVYAMVEMKACRNESMPYNTVDFYRGKFPRHTAFKSELESCDRLFDKKVMISNSFSSDEEFF